MRNQFGFFAMTVATLVVILTQYQNCGQVGGDSPFGKLGSSSVNCNSNLSSCSQYGPGSGDVNQMSITVSNASTTMSSQDTTVSIKGTCNNGGYSRTQITWLLYLNGAVVKSSTSSLANTRCDNGTFISAVSGFPSSIAAGQNYTVHLQLFGITDQGRTDTRDDLYTEQTIIVQNLIPAPVIDSRGDINAINSGYSYNIWDASKGVLRPIFAGSTIDYQTRQDAILSVFVGGFCKYTSNTTFNTVNVYLEEVGADPKDQTLPPVTKNLAYQTTCRQIQGSGIARPSDSLLANFDGYFSLAPAVPVLSGVLTDGTTAARHYVYYATQTDINSGTLREGPRSSPFQARFNNPNPQYGRGWTLPVAQRVLTQLQDALYLQWISNVSPVTRSQTNIFMLGKLAVGTGPYSLRKWMLDNMGSASGVFETAQKSTQSNNTYVRVIGSYSTQWGARLTGILKGISKCDAQLDQENLVYSGINTSNANDTHYGNQPFGLQTALGKLSDLENQQIQKLAVCFHYWLWKGMHRLSPYDPADSTWKLEEVGSTARLGVNVITFNGDGALSTNPADFAAQTPDGTMTYTYGASSVLYTLYRDLAIAAAVQAPQTDLTQSSKLVQNAYDGFTQIYLNALMDHVTDFMTGLNQIPFYSTCRWNMFMDSIYQGLGLKNLLMTGSCGADPMYGMYAITEMTSPGTPLNPDGTAMTNSIVYPYSFYPYNPERGSINANASAYVPSPPGGTLHIVSATYGANVGASNNALSDIMKPCEGRTSCSYTVTPGVYGDPKPGWSKDFQVVYTCSGGGSNMTASLPAEAANGNVMLNCN